MTDDVMLICNAVLVPYGLSHIGHHFDFGKSISYCDCTATQMYILLTRAQIHRHCLKIDPKICHKVILRQKI